jgi:hypothetical protein
MFQNLFLRVYVDGNINRKLEKGVIKPFVENLFFALGSTPLKKHQLPQIRTVVIGTEKTFMVKEENPNPEGKMNQSIIGY